jgi:hypothetical protein
MRKSRSAFLNILRPSLFGWRAWFGGKEERTKERTKERTEERTEERRGRRRGKTWC